jgi:peptide/nickel transport system ATP-binding protein
LGLALLGLVPPPGRVTGGSVRLRGRELLSLDETGLARVRGAEVGAIFQEPGLALNPVLTVGRQIAEVLRAHRRWPARRCRAEAGRLLAEVRLDGLASAYPHELSGGQRQRVLVAQALACRPALLIADEPTASLDAVLEAEVLALLAEMRERTGLAVLMISHSLRVLTASVTRVLVLYAGTIVESGALEAVLREPLHPYTRGLLASFPRAAVPGGRLPSIPGEPPGAGARPEGCVFVPRCQDRRDACAAARPDETSVRGRRVRCFLHAG